MKIIARSASRKRTERARLIPVSFRGISKCLDELEPHVVRDHPLDRQRLAHQSIGAPAALLVTAPHAGAEKHTGLERFKKLRAVRRPGLWEGLGVKVEKLPGRVAA